MTVVSLPGHGPLATPSGFEPVPSIIEALERALEQARRGEIRGIGLAIVRCNAVTGTAYAADPDEAVSHYLTAATAYLHQRYVLHKLDTSEPAEPDDTSA